MLPMVTEILDGPVAPVDRVYAFDRMHELCERAPRAVHRARAHLRTRTNRKGRETVVAEISLLIEGGLVVFATERGRSVREAVDRLETRLRYGLQRASLPQP
jgi:hypothetical protein